MSTKKTKLELTWIGKDQRPRLEPRILLEDPSKSYYKPICHTDSSFRHTDSSFRHTDESRYPSFGAGVDSDLRRNDAKAMNGGMASNDDIKPLPTAFDNRLIFGDNLLALKALEQEFAGKVKCVFIDPPYNTGSAFTHYDDGLEHSIWLGLMRDRLELIKRLLSDDGSLWVTLDDNEAHYFKVMADEVFGRSNFIANVIWEKKHTRANDAKWLSDNHDHIIVISKNKNIWRPNLLPRGDDAKGYSNVDNDPRGVWASGPCHVKTPSAKDIYPVTTPSGRVVNPPAGTSWRFSKDKFNALISDNRIYFGESGNNIPRYKRFLTEVQDGFVPLTLWFRNEVGDNQEAKTEVKQFNSEDVFSTPKPERLLERIIHLATNTGDLVLDSFAGSGTTGAVAHKMGRRWIMVELGEHCHTHIIPRLQKVIDGTDQGGISKAVNWQGGGGFRYYKLAGSLLEKDHWGNWVISKQYNPAMLTEALCKLEGFTYAPSESVYWQQGYSTETDYIYVTTQTLSAEQLQALSNEVGTERSLLVLCSAFKGNAERFSNLTIKKIPRAVLAKCEWGHDDYSLNVENLPMAEKQPENVVTRSARQSPKSPEQLSLLPETSEGA